MKKWETIGKLRIKSGKLRVDEVIRVLLQNRRITSKKAREEFLSPQLGHVTSSYVAINPQQLKKAVSRIKKAIDQKEQIVVFGDYDVDGICGSAILWETLRDLGASALPYIPHRIDEGYGLSIRGIENLKSQIPNPKLIITVDNGIVANEAVDYANQNGIDVIITDHHVPSKKKPKAYAMVHTIKLCGAGVTWLLSQEIRNKSKAQSLKLKEDDHIGLVALATIADLVPLTGANRVLTKYGLEVLRETERLGIVALCREAGIDQPSIDTYEVGHIIAPRLNAMGRLEYAMESLRLLCTNDARRAQALAHKLGSTNRERQLLTEETVLHAKQTITMNYEPSTKLLFISHESYQQGVIGLVAGKLVEEFYRPAIVVSIGKDYSKASARSIHGFNIIEFIRGASEFLVDAGGHPMAAGFTVETAKLTLLQKALEERIALVLDDDKLTRSLRVDCELPFSAITNEFYSALQSLAPFGMGNPQPTFLSRHVTIEDIRLVGNNGKHLKLRLQQTTNSPRGEAGNKQQITLEAIAFGMGERAGEIRIGDPVDIVYTIAQDEWNENKKLQLKIKDIKKSQE